NAGLARDKDYATPSAFDHSGHKRATQSHTTHHVDVEDLQPRLIGDIGKGDRREDADIVDEDVDSTRFTDEPHDTARRSEISGDANGPVTCRLVDGAGRFCDAVCTAAVDDDLRTFLRQAFGNCVADAGRGTSDEGTLAVQSQIHKKPRSNRGFVVNECPLWVISRHFCDARVMSAFNPKADVRERDRLSNGRRRIAPTFSSKVADNTKNKLPVLAKLKSSSR